MKVLFVCMGNICRSPTAEGVVRKRAEERGLGAQLEIDSAGTHAYHVGEPPDPRAQSAAARRGIMLDDLRARAVEVGDYTRFDLILAMDRDNLRLLQRMAPPDATAELKLMLEFAANHTESEVPDPYYGGEQGFEHVLDLLEDAAEGFLASLK